MYIYGSNAVVSLADYRKAKECEESKANMDRLYEDAKANVDYLLNWIDPFCKARYDNAYIDLETNTGHYDLYWDSHIEHRTIKF